MDHHEQQREHHKHEREEKKKEHRAYEEEQEKRALPIHPRWLLVIGIVLVAIVILVWTIV